MNALFAGPLGSEQIEGLRKAWAAGYTGLVVTHRHVFDSAVGYGRDSESGDGWLLCACGKVLRLPGASRETARQ